MNFCRIFVFRLPILWFLQNFPERGRTDGPNTIGICLAVNNIKSVSDRGIILKKKEMLEVVAGGYIIDMADLPKVHFSEHPEWKAVYDATWNIHKESIQKNPESSQSGGTVLCGRAI